MHQIDSFKSMSNFFSKGDSTQKFWFFNQNWQIYCFWKYYIDRSREFLNRRREFLNLSREFIIFWFNFWKWIEYKIVSMALAFSFYPRAIIWAITMVFWWFYLGWLHGPRLGLMVFKQCKSIIRQYHHLNMLIYFMFSL